MHGKRPYRAREPASHFYAAAAEDEASARTAVIAERRSILVL